MTGKSARPLRVLFAGTPEIALFSLERVLREAGAEWTVVGVLTNPDAPRGRGRRVQPSPVKVRAQEAGLPVLQPERLNSQARSEVYALQPDILVVVAYGKIFGPKFLSLFPRGGVNVHPSLLPRHRGPSPLQAAILSGDRETGVSIQYLAQEMDAGDIILQERTPLGPNTTVSELHDQLGQRGAELLTDALRQIARGTVTATPQNEAQATYCTKVGRSDGELSWEESADEIHRKVRALTPWPGVRCRWNGVPLQITETVLPETAHSDTSPPKTGHPDTVLPEAVHPDTRHPETATPEGHRAPEGSSYPSAQGAAAVPGSVLAVDSALGILVQTTDGVLAIRRLKQHARKELDFRSFVNGNSEIIGSVLQQA
ncbi:MAG: methionyl-tRNA formyltransferase [Alkalispirochaeta sp.]